jgi:hypothetical protein
MSIPENNNRWTFIEKRWRKSLCKCECWTEKEIYTHHYKDWSSKSCWCLQKERTIEKSKKHWMYKTKFYRTWQSINQRCTNPNHQDYYNYGGRWITVEWNSFEEFMKDMYQEFSEHHKQYGWQQTTIDRKKVNLNYSKDNCRWVNRKVQNNNKRIHSNDSE